MTTVLDGEAAIRAALGTHLGFSDWLAITDERVAAFAAATGHGDLGYLAIALTNLFLPQIVEIQGFAMGVNYGVEQVRYPSPLAAGDRVRGGAELTAITDVNGGVQTLMRITVEIDGRDEPACVVDSLSRWLS